MSDPISLYKYRSLSGKENENRIKEIFEDHKVWFSKHEDFNDPFEFHFILSFDASTYEKIEAYARILQKRDSNLTSDFAKAKATSDILSMGKKGLRKWEENRLKAIKEFLNKEIGVFSLTEHKDNILMWSHYADKHKGICIEFSPTVDNEHVDFFSQAQKVVYPEKNDFPTINFYMTDTLELPKRSVLTKAIHWKYEGEWRILDVKKGPGKKSIPEGIISSVILGCRIRDDDRKLVIELAYAYPSSVAVFESHIKPGYYELEFSKI